MVNWVTLQDSKAAVVSNHILRAGLGQRSLTPLYYLLIHNAYADAQIIVTTSLIIAGMIDTLVALLLVYYLKLQSPYPAHTG